MSKYCRQINKTMNNIIRLPRAGEDNHPRRRLTLLFILSGALLWLAAAPHNAAGQSCAELLRDRCETCHYLTRVCEKVEKDLGRSSWFGGTAGSWKRTIKNMVRQGAKLDNGEETVLADCLSTPAPEVLDICNLQK
jgi:hypothetical protein